MRVWRAQEIVTNEAHRRYFNLEDQLISWSEAYCHRAHVRRQEYCVFVRWLGTGGLLNIRNQPDAWEAMCEDVQSNNIDDEADGAGWTAHHLVAIADARITFG